MLLVMTLFIYFMKKIYLLFIQTSPQKPIVEFILV